MNKHSPFYTLYSYYLNRLYEVRNKTVASGKSEKINKRRSTFILDSRVPMIKEDNEFQLENKRQLKFEIQIIYNFSSSTFTSPQTFEI